MQSYSYIPFPDIFTLHLMGFSFSLRWYAMAYICALLIGWRLVVATMKRPRIWLAGS